MRRRRQRIGLAAAVVCSLLCAVPPSMAAEDTPQARARAEFELGLSRARAGDLNGAAEAFESAYRTAPRVSVLYNIGKAYAALNRPVEAVATLERYRAEGGELAPERRAEVDALIAQQKARIGSIEFQVDPPGADITIDGRSIGQSPLSGQVAVASGPHGVLITAPSRTPSVQTIRVAAGETARVVARLAALEAKPLGFVMPVCGMPGTDVTVDHGTPLRLPVAAPLVLDRGVRVVEFRRTGYVVDRHTLQVTNGELESVTCRLRPAEASAASRGRLSVRVNVPDSRARLDGVPYRGEAVPPGPHRLEITRFGFAPYSALVDVQPGSTRNVTVRLDPTPEFLDSTHRARRRQRAWAIGVGASGLALSAVGVGTYVWNASRYEDWRDRRRETDEKLASGDRTPATLAENSSLNGEVARLRGVDDLGIGLVVGGLVTTAVSAALWYLAPESALRFGGDRLYGSW